PSGYYGPSYGMPHHDRWSRQTKANNSILVNGAGQVDRSAKAQGRISDFQHREAITYVCGDAAAAYGGKLSTFFRHVVFLRPGLIAMVDELEAPEPAEYRWLLHGFEQMQLDEAAGTVTSFRKGATLTVKLDCDQGFGFSQTDQFDTPYNEGNPPEYWEDKADQWHFTARTLERARRVRIAASMVVRGVNQTLETEWMAYFGWRGVRVSSDEGDGEIWMQVTAGLKPPYGGIPLSAMMAAHWQPKSGPEERLVVESKGR
ncbi:MAG: heparinase II/III family protein, partial [Bryobacterales bacterium]|nr:heparinase II/III family protein [Bryobacterales bacterium]